MHFSPGVDLVDEQMVFNGCATAYRILVRWYYPLLIVLRAEPVSSGQFPNTVALYEAWTEGRLLPARSMTNANSTRSVDRLLKLTARL